MNCSRTQCTIDIIARCLPSVDQATLQTLLGYLGHGDTSVKSILRYLRRVHMVEANVVNLPSQVQLYPLYVSAWPSPLVTSMLVTRLRRHANEIMLPSTMYRASRLLCGLVGRNYQRQYELQHWYAQQRLATAFQFHCSKLPAANGWSRLESPVKDQSALWAAIDKKIICVPVHCDARTVHVCVTHAQRTGAIYEIW
jgi:hypothetical protein